MQRYATCPLTACLLSPCKACTTYSSLGQDIRLSAGPIILRQQQLALAVALSVVPTGTTPTRLLGTSSRFSVRPETS